MLSPSSAGRLPKALHVDEEDGRPGAMATQAGQPDAQADALPNSLRSASACTPESTHRPTFQRDLPTAANPRAACSRHQHLSTKENANENVPGK